MHAPAAPMSNVTTAHTMLSRGVWALPVYTGLALFIAGAVLVGTATARVDGLRSSGITYAASLTMFVVASFTIPILQPVMAAVLAIATLTMARRLNQGRS